MNKRLHLVPLLICFLVIMSCFFSSDAQSKPSQDNSKDLLNMILKNESRYINYNVETVSGNFDSNGSTGYFFVFTEKAMEEDAFDYSVDIWYGSGSKVSKVAGELNISPDTFGSIKLGGKTYFRYDLLYATDSQTILVGVNGGKCIERFRAPGPANFVGGNSFTVVCSAYDLIKFKGDDFTVGHTWKNYYFYVDSKGFHEYSAKQITSKDFNKYANAAAIIRNLNKEFLKKDTKVSFRFLKRSNNFIHINIDVETKESVSHSYSTYKIVKNNQLTLVDSGEGSYLNAVSQLK
jgi:hypothetical protein